MKDYAIYFFTLILGVAIFYVFNAIASQTVSLNININVKIIVRTMERIFSVVSVFVSIVLGFLIIYASGFMVKRRNKEFGVYLTLGMGKRKVSLILFFETILIGIISLVFGLIIGIILSQFMSLFVANLFEADMTKFVFTFSETTMIKTVVYFSIMYILVMIFNTQQISRYKLIDLLYASKKSEKIRIKNPILCIIVFLIACITLAYSYFEVTVGVKDWETPKDFYIPVIMGAIATILIFWSLSGLILRIVMSIKQLYYSKINTFVLKQISSKINTMVFSISIICLLLFFTICILSSALSTKNYSNSNYNHLPSADIRILKMGPDNSESIEDEIRKKGFGVEESLKNMESYNIYLVENLNFKMTWGYSSEEIIRKYPSAIDRYEDSPIECIKLSEYNRIAKKYGMDTYTLDENEYIISGCEADFIEMKNILLKNGEFIEIHGKKYYPKYDKCKKAILTKDWYEWGTYIVPDSAQLDTIENIYLLANYNTKDVEKRERIGSELGRICSERDYYLYVDFLKDERDRNIGEGVMITFIALYIGITFLITSAAILALKELSESTDNRERYSILRKIGTDERMINRALLKQIAVFFMFPLALAGIHSYFGIRFCAYLLDDMGKNHIQMLESVGITALILVVIYGGYFLLTYLCSKEIIKER